MRPVTGSPLGSVGRGGLFKRFGISLRVGLQTNSALIVVECRGRAWSPASTWPSCLPTGLAAPPARVAAAAKSAPAAAGRLRTRFVDVEAAAAELVSVERGDRLLRLIVGRHFHEREAAGPARRHIAHDRDPFDRSRTTEELLKLRFAGLVRKVSYV